MKRYDKAENITITNVNEPIELYNCTNVRIHNCKISGINQVGIYVWECSNVTIQGCTISNVKTGVRASRSTGLFVYKNNMTNMQGANPLPGSPKPDGQFVQLIECYGGNKIMNNTFTNAPGKSNPEDAINIYKSNGTRESPIQIAYNKITGGGPSKTGGGIALGDEGGSFQEVFENNLKNPGQYGIGVAGGHDISVFNNIVYGAKAPYTNIGISAWNQYPYPCFNIRIFGNDVNWTAAGGYRNDVWFSDNVKVETK